MTRLQKLLPWIVLALALWSLASVVMGPRSKSGFDFEAAGRIPICADGRVKPLDTFARNTLMSLSGRQSLSADGVPMGAVQWLLELTTDADSSGKREVFRIDHPDILAILGIPQTSRTRFSFKEIEPHLEEISKQANMAEQVTGKQRDPFQRQVVDLENRLMIFAAAAHLDEPLVLVPMSPGEQWKTLPSVLDKGGSLNHPSAKAWIAFLTAYSHGNADGFNQSVREYLATTDAVLGGDAKRAGYEVVFNRLEPFLNASALYVGVFVLAALGFLLRNLSGQGWSKSLGRATLLLLALAFIVHTAGLVSRIYIQGRPPVTNLYSSAVFIGWACIPLAMSAEWFFRLGIGTIVASLIGFGTLVIAHNLASSGDTLEMMQAVLDTNFWLATHVVVVTIGYSSTFLAGFLGAMYLVLGVPTRLLRGDPMKALPKMIYGVICFASIASFVGTVLGGIWADQSWGRFWGWDPKENGAALIVLMNLLTLHARWGGMIKERGVAVLAVLGNIVTAWSWFGTNMLGVGLHSYGFMESAVFWLGSFCVLQLLIMCLGFVPTRSWRSLTAAPKSDPPGASLKEPAVRVIPTS
jgi:ABC-type transport system involved in cytochrome c biogenesis permease subunit